MGLADELLAVGTGERAASFEVFAETLEPEWIAQALTATGGDAGRDLSAPVRVSNGPRVRRLAG